MLMLWGIILNENYYDIQGVYGYNGIISNNSTKNFLDAFYMVFNEFCQNENIIAEFTRFNPLIDNVKNSKEHLAIVADRKTIVVDLEENFDNIYSCYSSSNRRAIKKAAKNNLLIQISYTDEYKKPFTDLYFETMKRVGSNQYLFFSDAYFDFIYSIKSLVQFNVIFEEQIIASSLCFENNGFLHYHLGASKAEFLNLRPNNVLFNGMIRYGIDKGYEKLHLGGGSSTDVEDSLFKFKKSFNGNELEFCIGKKVHNMEVYNEVINQWNLKNPSIKEKYRSFLLRYRENI